MNDLVPLRVKIRHGLVKGRLGHVYPDFNSLNGEVRENMDWSEFVDARGISWHYDRLSGFGEVDGYNPDPDVWFGCLCMPEAFAKAALAAFGPGGAVAPGLVEEIDEDAFEEFYDQRAHAHEADEICDVNVLQALAAKKALDIPMTPDDLNAINPTSPQSGIKTNPGKTWKRFKARRGLSVVKRLEKK